METENIKAKITEAMRLVSCSTEPVFLREISVTGGDVLLGIKGSETIVDTEVEPRPCVTNISERQIAFSNGRLLFGDQKILFPPGITRAEIESAEEILIGTRPYRLVMLTVIPVGGVAIQSETIVRPLIKTT